MHNGVIVSRHMIGVIVLRHTRTRDTHIHTRDSQDTHTGIRVTHTYIRVIVKTHTHAYTQVDPMDNAVIVNILDDAQQGSPADQVPTLRKSIGI